MANTPAYDLEGKSDQYSASGTAGQLRRPVIRLRPDRSMMQRMLTRNAGMRTSARLTESDQTKHTCYADIDVFDRVVTSSSLGFAVRNHSARLPPVAAIATFSALA
jgi:hypothetical protein